MPNEVGTASGDFLAAIFTMLVAITEKVIGESIEFVTIRTEQGDRRIYPGVVTSFAETGTKPKAHGAPGASPRDSFTAVTRSSAKS